LDSWTRFPDGVILNQYLSAYPEKEFKQRGIDQLGGSPNIEIERGFIVMSILKGPLNLIAGERVAGCQY